MGALILQIVGLMINIALLIIFFSKEHIVNKETKIYSKMLILNTIFLLIGIITFIVAKVTNNFSYISILQKTYMSMLIILISLSMLYCLYVAVSTMKNDRILKISLTIITLIIICLIFKNLFYIKLIRIL